MYRMSAATHCRTDPEIAAIRILPHPPYTLDYLYPLASEVFSSKKIANQASTQFKEQLLMSHLGTMLKFHVSKMSCPTTCLVRIAIHVVQTFTTLSTRTYALLPIVQPYVKCQVIIQRCIYGRPHIQNGTLQDQWTDFNINRCPKIRLIYQVS